MLTKEELEKRVNDSYELSNKVLITVPEPMVSVRTSTYQHVAYIRDCLEGVLIQQTKFQVEYIIGEDFSKDGTREIVFEYAKKYPDKIRVITADHNVGSKANGTRSIRACRGKYIALCEGDDCWTDPLKLQKQVDFLEANPEYSMCFHNAVVEVTDKQFAYKKKLYKHLKEKDYSGKELLERWTIPTASVVYRRIYQDIISHTPKHPDFMYGDIILFLNLAELGKIRCLNQKMSVYRVHGGGVSNALHPAKRIQYIKHQLAIQNSFGGNYKYVTNAIIAKFYLQIAYAHFGKTEFVAGFKNLTNCMYYSIQGIVFAPLSFFRMIIKNVIWKQ